MSVAFGVLDGKIRREVLDSQSDLGRQIREEIRREVLNGNTDFAKLLQADFSKKLAENFYRPTSFSDLTFAFTDREGRKYYSWQNFGEIPPIRTKAIEAVLLMIDRRLSDKDIAEIADNIISLVQDGIIALKEKKDRAEAAAKLTVLAQELKYRAKDIIPEDLYYDLAAYCVVRDDERPNATDRTIHEEKWTMLKEAGKEGASFFLHTPIFGDLLGASLTTEAGLLQLLPRWTRMKERKANLTQVLSAKLSGGTTTASSGSPSGSRAIIPKATKR